MSGAVISDGIQALDSPVRRSVFNEDVLTLHVAVFAHSVANRRPRRTNIR
jgi:hypothetical protein